HGFGGRHEDVGRAHFMLRSVPTPRAETFAGQLGPQIKIILLAVENLWAFCPKVHSFRKPGTT
ncbi:MAG TPA: hypothetical protein VK934_07130, partial [Fimbriimonas sp.]|nr:hypothetical protein [Fimbriimonas sp.]